MKSEGSAMRTKLTHNLLFKGGGNTMKREERIDRWRRRRRRRMELGLRGGRNE